MRNHKSIALVLALALSVLVPASALAEAGSTERPLTGSGSGTIRVDPATGAFDGDTTGVSSLIGKYSLHFEGTGAPAADGTFQGSGTVTIVAANGDQLTGTFTVSSSGNTHRVIVTITGGTGQFTNAAGTITIVCVSGPTTYEGQMIVSEIECTLKGRLSY